MKCKESENWIKVKKAGRSENFPGMNECQGLKCAMYLRKPNHVDKI